MSLCQLLKHHIDEHKISIKDIAKAGGFNVSSIRTAIYNDKLSFEKFCQVAIITGFDLMKPLHFNMLAERYEMDADEMKNRLTTYAESLKAGSLVKEEKMTIEKVLSEAEEDTAKLALEIKMVAAAEKASQKKEIPVPEDLDQEVEAVINNEEKQVTEIVSVPSKITIPFHYCKEGELSSYDITKSMVANLQGMEAVNMSYVVKYLYRYKNKDGVEDLKKARAHLDDLIQMLEE